MALLDHLTHERHLSQTDLKNILTVKQPNNQGYISRKKPERRLIIDSHKPTIDMKKFDMPTNLY